MVMACDLVFAAESAKLGDAHSNFGVFPGAGGAAILPRRIGLNRAKYLLFSGENVSAQDMMDWGLVNKVVPDAELHDAVQAFTDKLADKSPAVLRRMKAVANRSLNVDEAAALSEEMLNLRAHMRSWDMREGLAAFNEKRKPQFRGLRVILIATARPSLASMASGAPLSSFTTLDWFWVFRLAAPRALVEAALKTA